MALEHLTRQFTHSGNALENRVTQLEQRRPVGELFVEELAQVADLEAIEQRLSKEGEARSSSHAAPHHDGRDKVRDEHYGRQKCSQEDS